LSESTARTGLSALVPLLAGLMLVLPFYWWPPWHVWLVVGVVWVTSVVVLCWLWSRHNYELGVQREIRETQQKIDRPRQAPVVAQKPEPAPPPAGERQAEWPPKDQSF
jgi:hypothetical protein